MPKRDFPKEGTLPWMLASDDWSDLTSTQIAEVLDAAVDEVIRAISYLKRRYGIIAAYKRRMKRTAPSTVLLPPEGTQEWQLYAMREKTENMTLPEIGAELGIGADQAGSAIRRLKMRGILEEYRRRKTGAKKKGTNNVHFE